MTVWLAILAIVGGAYGVFLGMRTLVDTLWPLPDPKPRPRARVVDTRHVRVVERQEDRR